MKKMRKKFKLIIKYKIMERIFFTIRKKKK